MKNDKILPAYETWLRASSRSDGTISLRMRHMRALARRLPLALARERQLQEVLGDSRHLSTETRHSMLASWRLFYGWARAKRFIMDDPTTDLESIPVPVRMPRVARDRDILMALQGSTPRDRGLVMLGRYACLRLTEISTLHMRDRDGDLLRVLGKGNKERIVYVNDDLAHALTRIELEQPRGYYFPGGTDGHMHPQSVHKIIKRLTGWNPHALRHAGATAAYRATGDLRAVQDMLGHASLLTTQRYLHLDDAARRAAAAGTIIRPPSALAA
jgi:integrase/recombinase XerC